MFNFISIQLNPLFYQHASDILDRKNKIKKSNCNHKRMLIKIGRVLISDGRHGIINMRACMYLALVY